MIEFVIQMSAFQRRMHWMLSGLMQQVPYRKAPVPAIRIRIDTHRNDPYREYNADLRQVFDNHLDILWREHADGDYNYRGRLRNKALQESDADWLLFSDADMIYPPSFMAQLDEDYLRTRNYDKAMLSVSRGSTKRNPADKAVAEADYSQPIPDVFETTRRIYRAHKGSSSIPRATGYFQLCRREGALAKGTYCQNRNAHDIPLCGVEGGRYGSDVQFRRNWLVVPVQLPALLHLRHARSWKGEWKGECR